MKRESLNVLVGSLKNRQINKLTLQHASEVYTSNANDIALSTAKDDDSITIPRAVYTE